jgi:RimJ/RimL family protein N-acetyltransferase
MVREMNIIINEIDKENPVQLSLLLSWRSNPLIYSHFLEQREPLVWDEHFKFISNTKDRIDYLVFMDLRPVGHLAISNISSEFPEISIMIGETTLWGKGHSKHILKKFIDMMISKGFIKFSARISDSNFSSINLFTGMGFKNSGKLVNNSDWSYYKLIITKN